MITFKPKRCTLVTSFCLMQLVDKIVFGKLNTNSAINIISQHGYPFETHADVETKDGYLLDMQRIPRGIHTSHNATERPAILLMHGLLGSAENWIVTGPEKGLAFILAEEGYDVWLGNARGTTHSRKHKTLNPDLDPEFWQFSWHEIGIYDLPAKIDYILKETGQKSIFYVGHSQGTTSFFVMASELPKYNSKIRLMIALAPVTYVSNLGNPFLQIMSRFKRGIGWILNFAGLGEFMPNNEWMSLAGEAMCNEKSFAQEACTNLLFLFGGYDSTEINRTALPAILSASPAGASSMQILHYAQILNSGSFRQFDYSMTRNLIKYGTAYPPRYKLNRIMTPVALFYANNDWLVSIQDVQKLERELPNVVYSYLVPYEKFNHLDFLWASSVSEMLYQRVLNLLKEY